MQSLLITAAAGLLLSVGAYFYGRNVESDIQEARANKAILEQTQKVLATERKYAELSKEVEDELKPKLAAAESDARSLARRLREQSCRRPLPEAAGTAGEPAGPAGDTGQDQEIGRATEELFGAAARDAERLRAWQDWYRAAKALLGQ